MMSVSGRPAHDAENAEAVLAPRIKQTVILIRTFSVPWRSS